MKCSLEDHRSSLTATKKVLNAAHRRSDFGFAAPERSRSLLQCTAGCAPEETTILAKSAMSFLVRGKGASTICFQNRGTGSTY